MKLYSQAHYLSRLEEMYPEITRKSLKKILEIGNRGLLKGLRTRKTTFYFSGKDRIKGKKQALILFRFNTIAFNNKHNFIKRRKDERDRSE